jgi:hypothetical protein
MAYGLAGAVIGAILIRVFVLLKRRPTWAADKASRWPRGWNK